MDREPDPVRERRPWSLERRAWMVALLISAFSSLLMHVSPTDGSYWPKALGDLFVGLSLVMVFAGGRENGYGERGTLPVAVGVGLLAPLLGYAFDPDGPLGRVFGALEFFVVGMAIAGFLIKLNRRPTAEVRARDRGLDVDRDPELDRDRDREPSGLD